MQIFRFAQDSLTVSDLPETMESDFIAFLFISEIRKDNPRTMRPFHLILQFVPREFTSKFFPFLVGEAGMGIFLKSACHSFGMH